MPGAGHLVHMPGHIYIRVGRYHDAVRLNEHAVHADESGIRDQVGSGLYAGAYYPHNYHFMAFAATMAGIESTAVKASRTVAPRVPFTVARDVPWIQNAVVLPQLTHVTFGRWQAVLADSLPSTELTDAHVLARYARGVAHAALGDTARARDVLASLDADLSKLPRDPAARPLVHIARRALAGEIALRTGRPADAVREFRQAAAIEDALLYDEPPLWYYPIRHSLGRALLEAGRAAEAEVVYREDLDRFPENGWSLFGLSQSLRAQKKTNEAEAVSRRFGTAWAHADVVLTASRF
jgi:tetratricopeptide (TPR) repeat protein